jgi:hypothetical protein
MDTDRYHVPKPKPRDTLDLRTRIGKILLTTFITILSTAILTLAHLTKWIHSPLFLVLLIIMLPVLYTLIFIGLLIVERLPLKLAWSETLRGAGAAWKEVISRSYGSDLCGNKVVEVKTLVVVVRQIAAEEEPRPRTMFNEPDARRHSTEAVWPRKRPLSRSIQEMRKKSKLAREWTPPQASPRNVSLRKLTTVVMLDRQGRALEGPKGT